MSKQLSVYVTHITTVQQLSHFSTSSTRKWCPFGRQDNRKQNLHVSNFQRPRHVQS